MDTTPSQIQPLPALRPDSEQLQRLSKMVLYLWAKMFAMYGHKWAAQCGECPIDEAGTLSFAAKTWADAMVGFSPADVHRGLQALLMADVPSEWPPTLPQFRKLCMAPAVSKVPAHQPAFPVGHVIRKYIEKHGDPNTYSPLVTVSMLLAFEVTADEPETVFNRQHIVAALADSHSCAQALSQAHPEARSRMTDNLRVLQSRYA